MRSFTFRMLFSVLMAMPIFTFAQTVFEAENATTISKGKIENAHLGFSGEGYMNGDNEPGTYLEWVISMADAGEQTLTFTYAFSTGDNRNMMLSINGTDVDSVIFANTGAWTSYADASIKANLVQGMNTVRLTALTTTGGPNLDKMTITGNVTVAEYFGLTTVVQGNGTVSASPVQEYYALGEQVTLTAEAQEGYYFAGWLGNVVAQDSSISLTVDTLNYMTAIFMPYDVFANTTEQIGWCTYNDSVTGGHGGNTVVVTNQSELTKAISGSAVKIVQIQGTIVCTPMGIKMDVGSNTTVVGLGSDATLIGGGLRVRNANNVIIRNVTIKDAYVTWDGKTTDNDAIEINNSTHVWITHCDLSHFDDGACDIKNGSDYVTVSWCHFHNHHKVMLIGSGDDSPQDIGKLNVTIHHNWFDGRFGNGIGERLPRVRYGKAHVYNNYFNDVLVSGVMAGIDADMRVDNNYFLNVPDPYVVVGGTGGGNNKMAAEGNILVDCGSRRDTRGTVFNPSEYYEYTYDAAEHIPAIVMLGAGISSIDTIGKAAPVATIGVYNSVGAAVQGISCSPCPAKTELVARIACKAQGIAALSVVDMQGKETVLNSSAVQLGLNELNVNVSGLAPGNYLLKVRTATELFVEKICVD